LIALAALVACDPVPPEPVPPAPDAKEAFLEAFPKPADLRLSFPGVEDAPADATGGLGLQTGALVGEISSFYKFTRNTSSGVNLGLMALLVPIATVVNNVEPTVVEENRAVWHGSGALDPMDHLLVVERKDDGHFEYVNLSRVKADADAEWKPIMGGTYTPGQHRRRGQGAIWLNQENDRNPLSTGRLLALWSNVGVERTVTVYAFQWSGNTNKNDPGDWAYHFQVAEEGGGVFVFGMRDVDINNGQPGLELLENAAIISRWTAEGAGRADWYATEGDVARTGYEVGIVSQCWRPKDFKSVFETYWLKPFHAEATQVTAEGSPEECAFKEFGTPVFPDPIDPPADPPLPEEAR